MANRHGGSAPVISFRSALEPRRQSKRRVLEFRHYFLLIWSLATLAALPCALSWPTPISSATGARRALLAKNEEGSHSVRLLREEVVPEALSGSQGSHRSLFQTRAVAEEELIVASREGDLDKVVDLIENKSADPDYRAPATGTTPIIEAAYGGHVDVVKELMNHGADVNAATTDSGITALWFAAHGGFADVIELLLSEVDDIDQSDKNGTTPLYIAALNGHLPAVVLLIGRGASIDAPSIGGATALTAAVHSEHNDVIEVLLDSGADPNVKKKLSGQSNLWTAAYLGNVDAVHMLIEARAQVSEPANDKTTPLYISMVRSCLDCAVALLDAGASPNDEASLNNWSPLHAAAAMGFVEGVQLLLDRGANKDVLDNLTRRPIDVIGRTNPVDAADRKRLEDLLSVDESEEQTASGSDLGLRTLDLIDGTSNSSHSPVNLSEANVGGGESSPSSSTNLTLWAIILLVGLGALVAFQAIYIFFSKMHFRSDWSRGSQHSGWGNSLNHRLSTRRYGATSPVTVSSPVAHRTTSWDSGKHPFSPTQNVPPAPESPETRRPAAHPVLESIPSDLEDSATRPMYERPVNMEAVHRLYTTRESEYDGDGNYTSRGGTSRS